MTPCRHRVSPDKLTLTERSEPSNYTADLPFGSVRWGRTWGKVKGCNISTKWETKRTRRWKGKGSEVCCSRDEAGGHDRGRRWLWSVDLRVKYWRPSINPACPPLPHPFLYVTDSFPLLSVLTYTPLYSFGTPGFTPNPTSSNFTCLINTPAGLIWPCPAVMGRGIYRRSFG